MNNVLFVPSFFAIHGKDVVNYSFFFGLWFIGLSCVVPETCSVVAQLRFGDSGFHLSDCLVVFAVVWKRWIAEHFFITLRAILHINQLFDVTTIYFPPIVVDRSNGKEDFLNRLTLPWISSRPTHQNIRFLLPDLSPSLHCVSGKWELYFSLPLEERGRQDLPARNHN